MGRKRKLDDNARARYAIDAARDGVQMVSQRSGYAVSTIRSWMRRFKVTTAQTDDLSEVPQIQVGAGPYVDGHTYSDPAESVRKPESVWSGKSPSQEVCLATDGCIDKLLTAWADPKFMDNDPSYARWSNTDNNPAAILGLIEQFRRCSLADSAAERYFADIKDDLSKLTRISLVLSGSGQASASADPDMEELTQIALAPAENQRFLDMLTQSVHHGLRHIRPHVMNSFFADFEANEISNTDEAIDRMEQIIGLCG